MPKTLVSASPADATTRPVRLSARDIAALTPPSRDRALDVARAAAIVVVVVWHTVLSITHRNAAGAWTMPNPLDDIPLGWALTWVLQVMPLFFVVGGAANWIAYERAQAKGRAGSTFVWSRCQRLLVPALRFLLVWAVADVVLLVAWPGYSSVTHWGVVLFVPLWFVAMYALICATVPLGVALERRVGAASVVWVIVVATLFELVRRLYAPWLGVVSTPVVWFGCHQIGMSSARLSWWKSTGYSFGVAIVGLVGLVLTVVLGGYDPSLVARPGGRSNLLPTTLPVLWAGLFHGGLLGTLTPWLRRVGQRRAVWVAAIVVNGSAMTILCWHMTGHLVALLAWERVCGPLAAESTSGWWAQRPLWLLASVVTTAAVVRAFRRWER